MDRQTDRFAISISRVSVLTRDKNWKHQFFLNLNYQRKSLTSLKKITSNADGSTPAIAVIGVNALEILRSCLLHDADVYSCVHGFVPPPVYTGRTHTAFYRATLCKARTMLSQDVRLSVCLSVTRRYSVETAQHIKLFSHHFSFCSTKRYSIPTGTLPQGGSRRVHGYKKPRFSTNQQEAQLSHERTNERAGGQEAQLPQRDRAMLRVIKYFTKSLKVTECHSK